MKRTLEEESDCSERDGDGDHGENRINTRLATGGTAGGRTSADKVEGKPPEATATGVPLADASSLETNGDRWRMSNTTHWLEPARPSASSPLERYAFIAEITESLRRFNGTSDPSTGCLLHPHRSPALVASSSDPLLRGSARRSAVKDSEDTCDFHKLFSEGATLKGVCQEWCDGWPLAIADGYIWRSRDGGRRTFFGGRPPSLGRRNRQAFSDRRRRKGRRTCKKALDPQALDPQALSELIDERWRYLKTYVSGHFDIRRQQIHSDPSLMLDYLYDSTIVQDASNVQNSEEAGPDETPVLPEVERTVSKLSPGRVVRNKERSRVARLMHEDDLDSENNAYRSFTPHSPRDQDKAPQDKVLPVAEETGGLAASEHWASRCEFHQSYGTDEPSSWRQCQDCCNGGLESVMDPRLF